MAHSFPAPDAGGLNVHVPSAPKNQLSLSTLLGTTWEGTRVLETDLVTDSTYHPSIPFCRATDLRRIQRFGTLRRKQVTVRAYDAWLVNLIVRRGLQDNVGENVPVLLYAKSGQPAHAASQAQKVWRLVARRGKSEVDPWPDVDAEAVVERIDDNDFEGILRDARREQCRPRNFIGGDPLDPWVIMIGDRGMAEALLSDLKSRGPTYGGSIQEDLPIELGGRGIEMEADIHAAPEDQH